MFRPLLFACLAGVFWISTATADTLRTFRVENWQGGAYARRGTSEFNHCAASARYKSGVLMMFAINRAYQWSLGFASPQWTLVRGNRYPIEFRIDGSAPIVGTAVAIGANQVEVPLADDSALFEKFRWGRLLRVASAGHVLEFRLTDTAVLLPELLRCVAHYVRTRPPASTAGGFFTPQPAPTPAPATAAANRAEATTFAANLLAQSGLTGFRILGPDEIGTLKADAAWRAGSVIGTVSILSPSDLTLERIPGRLIAAAAQDCQGKFFSGSLPDTQGGAPAARVFTACQNGDDTLTVYYLGVPRPAGGFYVLTTSAFGNEQPAKEADQTLRAAVYKVLSK